MQLAKQIPPELMAKVERELQRGERISWIDMPVPRFFTSRSTPTFLFGIPWTLFAIFWTYGAAGFRIPDFTEGFQLFALFGLPFILIGIGMLSSPLLAYWKALKTVYVITDRRAIAFEGGWSRTIHSYPPSKLLNVYRKERPDGTGDVVISFNEWRDSDGDRRTETLGFLRIREPKTVEMMLRDLVTQAGIDVSANPPSSFMPQQLEHPSISPPKTIHESDLPQYKTSIRIGKLIVVLVISCLLGYYNYSSSVQDYQKGQSLTLNEYIEGFDNHKAKQLEPPGPLWEDILVVFLIIVFFVGAYELLGRGLGWILWRTILAKKSQTDPWRRTAR